MNNEFSPTRIDCDEFDKLERTADAEGFLVVPDESEEIPTDDGRDVIGQLVSIDGYRLIKKVGSGGSSVVYLAEDSSDASNRFAIKLFNRSIRDAGNRIRFDRETNALMLLDHPNIAKLVDFGVTFNGHPFIVFEFIDGDRIDVYCRKRETTIQHRVELLAAACSALQHAHDQGIVHRDLKPGNIIVSNAGKPYLTDFGLSKLFDDESPDAEKTRTGAILGTLNYLAPEQLFATKDPLSVRTDIFGLGAVLHVLLTRRPPLQFDNLVDAATSYFKRLPTRLDTAGVPGELEAICIKCLSANPQDRYPSADAVGMELQRFLDGKSVAARRPTLRQKYSLLTRQYPLLSRGIPLLLVILVVFSAVVMGLLKKSQDELMHANRSNQQLYDSMIEVSTYVRKLEELPETLDIRRGMLRMVCEKLSRHEEQFAERPELLFQFAVAEFKLSDLEHYKGNAQAGKEFRAKARDKFALLVLMDPSDERASVGLFQSLLWLGDYESAHNEIERLANRFPDNVDYKSSLCTTKLLIGDYSILQLDFDKTRLHYESARLIADGLPTLVPNANYSRRRAFSRIASARLALLDGELVLASELALDAIEIYETLDPLSLSTHGETDEYLKCLRLALSISAFRGDDAGVQAYFDKATDFYNLAMGRFSSYVQIHLTYCRILEDYSAHCFNIGDTEELLRTQMHWNRIVGEWQKRDEGSVDFCTEKLRLFTFPFFPEPDLEQIQRVSEELVALDPTWSSKNVDVGRAFLIAGNLPKAIQFFENSVSLETTASIAHRLFENAVHQIGLADVNDVVVDDETRRELMATTMSYYASMLEDSLREDLAAFY